MAEAATVAGETVRDVTRAGFFSQEYTISDPPHASGVQPSLFGCLSMIDFVWMLNGYRMDGGGPSWSGSPLARPVA